MNNQKMLDVVTMIVNIILPDKCDHESALEIWLRAMKRKAREALESRERERVPGNEAAMRDALKTIHDKVNSIDEECGVDPVEIRDIASAALSSPARNCDVEYADRVEMYGAFKDWCKAKGHTMEPMLAYDAFDWLLAPAAERKGEKDDCSRT